MGKMSVAAHRAWGTLTLAVKKFSRVSGAQWAAAFAFNAFFSLFPLIILFVTIASTFIDRHRAEKEIIAYVESYIPISGKMQGFIFNAISGVINVRKQAGVIAFLILAWAASQCVATLVYAINRAWNAAERSWWRLPLKSLVLLIITAGAVLMGMTMTALMRMGKSWLFKVSGFHPWVYELVSFFIPLLVIFLSLSLFYRLAPDRPMRFTQVWAAALCASFLLQAAESLFVIYLKKFATLNAVYGTFGGIMALLLWIYLSGCIFIFGACLCAAQAEVPSAPAGGK